MLNQMSTVKKNCFCCLSHPPKAQKIYLKIKQNPGSRKLTSLMPSKLQREEEEKTSNNVELLCDILSSP